MLEGSADFEPLPDPDPLPTPEASDNYVNANVMIPLGDSLSRGRVVEQNCDAEGNVMGRANDKPIRDTHQYVVKFDSGEVTELTAKVIAQSMYSMCDEDGYQVLLFDAIVEHKRDETEMTKADQTFVGTNDREYFGQSTRGWKSYILWKDGSTTWEKMSDFKECYPVETVSPTWWNHISRLCTISNL